MSVLASRPLLRWAVPLGVAVAVFGAGAGATVLRAAAEPSLPARSAAQLLVDLQTAKLDGLSGTVVQRADLGLPAIPGRFGGSGSASLSSLISGSHTLRVWYSGPDKVRLALLGTLGESDIIRNGRDVWIWSSDEKTAEHRTLPAGMAALDPRDATGLLATTPQEAADRILAALDPSTVVSTAGTARVAGRAAYELILAPRDAASLVNQVRLAVDGTEHVPLRVQVYAKGNTAPAFEVGFQQINFDRPGDEHFRFTPPPGTTLDEGDASAEPAKPGQGKPGAPRPDRESKPDSGTHPRSTVIGSTWTSVFVARVPQDALSGSGERGNPLGALLSTLPRVSGTWGSGQILKSKLVTALLTDDGRLLIGAVTADRLFQVAADPAAALG